MPNFAIIKNEKVVNIVVAETDYANSQGWIALPDNAGIGWDFVNGQFIDNRPRPEFVLLEPNKAELFAQLQELQAKIESLT